MGLRTYWRVVRTSKICSHNISRTNNSVQDQLTYFGITIVVELKHAPKCISEPQSRELLERYRFFLVHHTGVLVLTVVIFAVTLQCATACQAQFNTWR